MRFAGWLRNRFSPGARRPSMLRRRRIAPKPSKEGIGTSCGTLRDISLGILRGLTSPDTSRIPLSFEVCSTTAVVCLFAIKLLGRVVINKEVLTCSFDGRDVVAGGWQRDESGTTARVKARFRSGSSVRDGDAPRFGTHLPVAMRGGQGALKASTFPKS